MCVCLTKAMEAWLSQCSLQLMTWICLACLSNTEQELPERTQIPLNYMTLELGFAKCSASLSTIKKHTHTQSHTLTHLCVYIYILTNQFLSRSHVHNPNFSYSFSLSSHLSSAIIASLTFVVFFAVFVLSHFSFWFLCLSPPFSLFRPQLFW